MTTSEELALRERELELEAEAELELEQNTPAPKEKRSLAGATWDAVKEVPGDLFNLGKSTVDVVGTGLKNWWDKPGILDVVSGYAPLSTPSTNPITEIAQEANRRISGPDKLRLGLDAIAGAFSPFAVPVMDYTVSEIQQLMGATPEGTPEEEYKQVIKNLVIPGVIKAGGKVASKATGKVGAITEPNKTALLEQEAMQIPGAVGGVQNYPKGTTPKERLMSETLTEHEPTFYKNADKLMAGVNPADNAAGWKTYQQNLAKLKEESLAAKEAIIKDGSAAEAQAGKRLDPNYVNQSFFDKLLKKATPEEAAIIRTRRNELNRFLESIESHNRGPNRPTLEAANIKLGQIDRELASLGGYDDVAQINAYGKPSNYDIDVATLKQMRYALSEGISKYTEELLGTDAAQALRSANDNVSMVIPYEEAAARFSNEQVQGLAPGSDRSLVNAVPKVPTTATSAVVEGVKGKIAPGMGRRAALKQTINRPGEALRMMQRGVEANKGNLIKPRESFDILSDPGIAAVFNQAAQLTPTLLPRSPELVLKDPKMSTFLMSQVSPDVQDVLSDALTRKDPLAMEAAMTVAMAERPDLFEKSITGLSSEMVRGEDIVLTNPVEAKLYGATISSLYHQGTLDANFLAEQQSLLNNGHYMKILPRPDMMPETAPETMPTQAPIDILDSRISSYPN